MRLASLFVVLAVILIAPHLRVWHAIGYCVVLLVAACIAKWFGV